MRGPVSIDQFARPPSPVVVTAGVSALTAVALGSVLTVTKRTLAASGPRAVSAPLISAASTGQMSLHGPSKNVSTVTCPVFCASVAGWPFWSMSE